MSAADDYTSETTQGDVAAAGVLKKAALDLRGFHGATSAVKRAGESPQTLLIQALINFDKPIVAAVHGAAIGGGTTMLTHCEFVYAGESAKFQMPSVNLALVPEFGASCTVSARIGYLRAAELILLGLLRCWAGPEAWFGNPGPARREVARHSNGDSA
jgi:enoyl-CoA hydratase/carnithine racemase